MLDAKDALELARLAEREIASGRGWVPDPGLRSAAVSFWNVALASAEECRAVEKTPGAKRRAPRSRLPNTLPIPAAIPVVIPAPRKRDVSLDRQFESRIDAAVTTIACGGGTAVTVALAERIGMFAPGVPCIVDVRIAFINIIVALRNLGYKYEVADESHADGYFRANIYIAWDGSLCASERRFANA